MPRENREPQALKVVSQPLATRRVSVHEDTIVKSKVRRSGIFHASIRHHPP